MTYKHCSGLSHSCERPHKCTGVAQLWVRLGKVWPGWQKYWSLEVTGLRKPAGLDQRLSANSQCQLDFSRLQNLKQTEDLQCYPVSDSSALVRRVSLGQVRWIWLKAYHLLCSGTYQIARVSVRNHSTSINILFFRFSHQRNIIFLGSPLKQINLNIT